MSDLHNQDDTSELIAKLLQKKDPAIVGVKRILRQKEGKGSSGSFHAHSPEVFMPPDSSHSESNETIFTDSEKEVVEHSKEILDLKKEIEHLKALHKEELDEYFQRGVAEGKVLGAQEQQAQIVAQQEQEHITHEAELAQLVAHELAARNQFFLEAELDLLSLALIIAKRIIGEEIKTNPDHILRTVKNALSFVAGKSEITVRVSPEDHPFVREQITAITGSSDYIMATIIDADPSIKSGGCLIETASGIVDARIETQMNELESIIERSWQDFVTEAPDDM